VPDCKKLLGEMSEYVDGELSSDLCRELEAHLHDCPNCRVMLDSLTKTIRVFREENEEPLPEALKESLRTALARRNMKKDGS
jgi:RNA polymerase sigma-70 factor (ECF subfamily)